jgi:hypothetical protein
MYDKSRKCGELEEVIISKEQSSRKGLGEEIRGAYRHSLLAFLFNVNPMSLGRNGGHACRLSSTQTGALSHRSAGPPPNLDFLIQLHIP